MEELLTKQKASKDLVPIAESIDKFKIEHIETAEIATIATKAMSTAIVSSINESSAAATAASKSHIEALKKMQKSLDKAEKNYRNVSEKSLGESAAPTNVLDKFKNSVLDLKDWGKKAKGSISNSSGNLTAKSVLTAPLKSIAASASPKYAAQLDFIKNERNLGDKNSSDKDLANKFKQNNQFKQRNERNERNLTRDRGSLTKEEYLKGNSKGAQAYTAEQQTVGKGIKGTDTRFSIFDNPEESSITAISDVAKGKAKGIKSLGNINVDTTGNTEAGSVLNKVAETGSITGTVLTANPELDGATQQYQQMQLDNASDMISVQRDILKAVGGKSSNEGVTPIGDMPTYPSSTGTGLMPALSGITQTVPGKSLALTKESRLESEKSTNDFQQLQLTHSDDMVESANDRVTIQQDILKAIVSLGSNVGNSSAPGGGGGGGMVPGGGAMNAAKKGGSSVMKGLASAATWAVGSGVAAAAGVGIVGGLAAGAAAHAFSDSFGEGGFEIVKKLHDAEVIDYNATAFGLNQSEVLDWEAIDKLKPEEVKALIDSGVEFSESDTKILHKIYGGLQLTRGKKGVPVKQKAKPYQDGSALTEAEYDNLSDIGQEIEDEKAEMEVQARNAKPLNKYQKRRAERRSTEARIANFTDEDKQAYSRARNMMAEPKMATGELQDAVPTPNQAEDVYKQSGVNAGIPNENAKAVSNTVIAPTTNNINNTTKSKSAPLPPRNTEYNPYISTRFHNF